MKILCCWLFGLVLGALILFLLFKFKFIPELESSYTMSNKTCADEKINLINQLGTARDTATGCGTEMNTLSTQLSASTTSLLTCTEETNRLVAELNTNKLAGETLSKIIPDPSKVDRYWGCIAPADTPAGFIWATTDGVVKPKLDKASGLQAQLDVVRDSYPTAKYVAITQSSLHSDSLYVLWSTDPPSEKKIDSRNRRCLLPTKDGYVGCKTDTPIIGCLGDPVGGVTWTVYKIR